MSSLRKWAAAPYPVLALRLSKTNQFVRQDGRSLAPPYRHQPLFRLTERHCPWGLMLIPLRRLFRRSQGQVYAVQTLAALRPQPLYSL